MTRKMTRKQAARNAAKARWDNMLPAHMRPPAKKASSGENLLDSIGKAFDNAKLETPDERAKRLRDERVAQVRDERAQVLRSVPLSPRHPLHPDGNAGWLAEELVKQEQKEEVKAEKETPERSVSPRFIAELAFEIADIVAAREEKRRIATRPPGRAWDEV